MGASLFNFKFIGKRRQYIHFATVKLNFSLETHFLPINFLKDLMVLFIHGKFVDLMHEYEYVPLF